MSGGTYRRRLSRPSPFFAGMLTGVLLCLSLGGGATTLLLLAHPHLASRLDALLFPPPSQVIPIGDLSDVAVVVDAAATGHSISPFIYGVDAADPATLVALGATVNRWGGNSSTSYNWVIGHAWNAGRDWEFRNGNYGRSGLYWDHFVGATLNAGGIPLITIPSIGFVARNDNNQTRSVGVPAHGGPPASPGSDATVGYDPTANRLATSVESLPSDPNPLSIPPSPKAGVIYQDQWVYDLVQKYGAAPRGVRFFTIDNEPDLWAETHTDVHPTQMSYEDMLANYEEYAIAVKKQDPNAVLLGPDVSGWTSYFYSALDRGPDNYATHADRTAHDGTPFLQWWLAKVAAADRQRGLRSLDMLDVHFYPQAVGVYSGQHDAATQALRIRSVRALYDPTYRDESWIATDVDLIPRLKQWIAQSYPGTGLAITEYNWGGEHDASGAVALAESLGVFGREGVDLATYWTYPPPNSPAGGAFRLFRNFDGRGGTFGDISIPVTVNQHGVTAFAARHSNTGETDVVLVNESPNQMATVHLALKGVTGSTATLYQMRGGSATIVPIPLSSLGESIQLPPYSISLVKVTEG